MIEDKIDFRDMTIEELEEYVALKQEKKFRAKQIFKWIHRGIEDIDEMTDLPLDVRETLKSDGYTCNMEIEQKLVSKIDNTTKYLMLLKDNNVIECVVMNYDYGKTICISTQVGCSMGCSFCASGIGGRKRNLSAGEMLGQILKCQKDLQVKISNIVLMGTGEPLDNFENVSKFLELVNNPNGINIGMRHITLSTCGLVPEIKKLADRSLQLTLAISLHAPNNSIRKKIMPIANKYDFDEVLEACRYYVEKTNKRITFEYALIEGINDSRENAMELSNKLRGFLCHVNLIPVNKVIERDFEKSSKHKVEDFKNVLVSNGIETTIRRELGSDIDAACGQLRRSYLEKMI